MNKNNRPPITHRPRATHRSADDPPLLPQERGQQGAMPAMPRTAGVCTRAPVPLPVWREEEHLQALPHSLLQACHERTDA